MDDIWKSLLLDLELLAESSKDDYGEGTWDNYDAYVLTFNQILRKLKKLGSCEEFRTIESVPPDDQDFWGEGAPKEQEKLKEVSLKSEQLLVRLRLDMQKREQDERNRPTSNDQLSTRAESVTKSLEHFPTPPGTRWGEVSIRLVDGHRVSISVKDVKRIYNYTQMGMCNKKNGDPTVQWELLREFSYERGTIDVPRKSDPRAPRRQKQKENLAKDLKNFFRIKGDPIMTSEDKRAWQTRFRISRDR